MKYIIIAIVSVLFSCKGFSQEITELRENHLDTTKVIGFIFLDLAPTANAINIFNYEDKIIFSVKNNEVCFNNKRFDLKKEEHLYREGFKVEAFYPEHGLFVLKCYANSNGFYYVDFNNQFCKIRNDGDSVEFKDLESYILETYPIPTNSNPVRTEPNDYSKTVKRFLDLVFIPIEIKGDWVKVIDSKDCYSGEYPSKENIEGWIRWRRDGVIIINVAYIC